MKHFTAILLATLLTSGAAFAAGDAPKADKMLKTPMAKCGAGKLSKKMKNGKIKCTTLKVGVLPDTDLYAQGYKLAKLGDYDGAIEILSAVKNHNDPDVLNMLGYSNRKAGRIELGISYYAAALAQKPDFVKAREYLGEGYVAAGKVDLAKVQLAEIQKVCGTTCEEYKLLSKVIDGAVL